jgi:hypothetical protein
LKMICCDIFADHCCRTFANSQRERAGLSCVIPTRNRIVASDAHALCARGTDVAGPHLARQLSQAPSLSLVRY